VSRASKILAMESVKPNVKWPVFSDMYETASADGWLNWMLLNNPELTKADILALKVIHIDQVCKNRINND